MAVNLARTYYLAIFGGCDIFSLLILGMLLILNIKRDDVMKRDDVRRSVLYEMEKAMPGDSLNLREVIGLLREAVGPLKKTNIISRLLQTMFDAASRYRPGWEVDGPQVLFARAVLKIFNGENSPRRKAELIYQEADRHYHSYVASEAASSNIASAAESSNTASAAESSNPASVVAPSNIASTVAPELKKYFIDAILAALELVLYCFCEHGIVEEGGASVSSTYAGVLEFTNKLYEKIEEDKRELTKDHFFGLLATNEDNQWKRLSDTLFAQWARVSNILVLLCLFPSYMPAILSEDTEGGVSVSPQHHFQEAKNSIFKRHFIIKKDPEHPDSQSLETLWQNLLRSVVMPMATERAPAVEPASSKEEGCSDKQAFNDSSKQHDTPMEDLGSNLLEHVEINPAEMETLIYKFILLSMKEIAATDITLENGQLKEDFQGAASCLLAASAQERATEFLALHDDPKKFQSAFEDLQSEAKKRLFCSIGKGVINAPTSIKKSLEQLLEFEDAGILMLAIASDSVEMFEFLSGQIDELEKSDSNSSFAASAGGGSSIVSASGSLSRARAAVEAYQSQRLMRMKSIFDLEADKGIPFNILHLVCITGATKILQHVRGKCGSAQTFKKLLAHQESITARCDRPFAIASTLGVYSEQYEAIIVRELTNCHRQSDDFYAVIKSILESNPDLWKIYSANQYCIWKTAALTGNLKLLQLGMELQEGGGCNVIDTVSKNTYKGSGSRPNKFFCSALISLMKKHETTNGHKDPSEIWLLLFLQTITLNRAFPSLIEMYHATSLKKEWRSDSLGELMQELMGKILLEKSSRISPRAHLWFCTRGMHDDGYELKKSNFMYMCNVLKGYVLSLRANRGESEQEKANTAIQKIENHLRQVLLGMCYNLQGSASKQESTAKQIKFNSETVTQGADILDYIKTVYLLVSCLTELLIDLGEKDLIAKHAHLFFDLMKANGDWELTTGTSAKHDSLREVLIKIALVLKSALYGAEKGSVTTSILLERQGFEEGLSRLVFGHLAEGYTHQAAEGGENRAGGSGGSASTQGSSAAANDRAVFTIDSRHLLSYSRALAGSPLVLTNPLLRSMIILTTFDHNAIRNTSTKTLEDIQASAKRVEDMVLLKGTWQRGRDLGASSEVTFSFLNKPIRQGLLAYLSTPDVLALASAKRGAREVPDGSGGSASRQGGEAGLFTDSHGGKGPNAGSGGGSSSASSVKRRKDGNGCVSLDNLLTRR